MFTTVKITDLEARFEKIKSALINQPSACSQCSQINIILGQLDELKHYTDEETQVTDVLLLNLSRVESALTTLQYLEEYKYYDCFLKELLTIDDYLCDILGDLPDYKDMPAYNAELDAEDAAWTEEKLALMREHLGV
jgi:hypothetical protein